MIHRFAGETSITNVTGSDEATSEEIYTFRKECPMFLAKIIKNILERSLFGLLILQCMPLFNPQELARIYSSAQEKRKEVFAPSCKIETFFNYYWWQSGRPIFYISKKNCGRKFKQVHDHCITQPFDLFYFNEVNTNTYIELSVILQLVLTLSHGQATIERGFSANKTILEENMDKESV